MYDSKYIHYTRDTIYTTKFAIWTTEHIMNHSWYCNYLELDNKLDRCMWRTEARRFLVFSLNTPLFFFDLTWLRTLLVVNAGASCLFRLLWDHFFRARYWPMTIAYRFLEITKKVQQRWFTQNYCFWRGWKSSRRKGQKWRPPTCFLMRSELWRCLGEWLINFFINFLKIFSLFF